jgi:glycosidase
MCNRIFYLFSFLFLYFVCGVQAFAEPESLDNLLKNGDFSAGTSDWTLWANDGGKAVVAVENSGIKITVTNPGKYLWSIGLNQHGFLIENGATYTLSFRARSDGLPGIKSIVQLDTSPYSLYSGGDYFALTPVMTDYSCSFTMQFKTDKAAALVFMIGAQGNGTVYLDGIVVRKTPPVIVEEQNYPVIKPAVDRSNIIIYEIVPASYNGGSWGGAHCLSGITDRLDLIKNLGVNCIWLTPVFEGDGMGYWTFDYYKVNPDLGTANDLKKLVYEAHKRNIMVILDLVVNHTWKQHPFFQDVLNKKDKSAYKDYYIWKGKPGASDYVYYYDWSSLPNLNLSNPDVREYLYGVATYWVGKLDIDGYRVDVAWGLEDRYPGFGAELKKRLAAIKPDFFLLAEGNVNDARFFKNGYDSAYDWNLRNFAYTEPSLLPQLFSGTTTPQGVYSALTRVLPANGLPLRFAENHDHPRAASLWGSGGSKIAHTIIMTARGYPLVFGGGETGFVPSPQQTQNDPVIWDFNSALYTYFKKIIAVRNRYLKSNLTQYCIKNDSNVIYSSLSVSGTNKLITVANCSKKSAKVTLALTNPELGTIAGLTELITDSNVPYAGKGTLTLTLAGYETAILLVQ